MGNPCGEMWRIYALHDGMNKAERNIGWLEAQNKELRERLSQVDQTLREQASAIEELQLVIWGIQKSAEKPIGGELHINVLP